MRLSELGAGWRAFDRDLRRSLRALIVADEPEARGLLQERLQLCGVRSEGCSTAEKALERLCELPFDLLLAHEDLPGMDGVELCARLRALRLVLPVVVLTREPSAVAAAAALRAGADDCLSRPLDLALLEARLGALLDARIARLVHDRVILDLRRLVEEGADRARLEALGRELLAFKRALAARPRVVVVMPSGEELPTLAAEGLEVLVETRTGLLERMADPARAPLVVVLPLALPGAAGLARELRAHDPLVELLVRVEDERLHEALSVLQASASELVLAAEGPVVLATRAARLAQRGKRRLLHLHLLATLWRAARDLGERVAEPLGRLVPPEIRESLDRWAATAAPLPLAEEVDLSDLFETWETIELEFDEP